jgi:hypothetical protein
MKNKTIGTIEAERDYVLEQMREIRSAHPGGVSEQLLKGTRQDKAGIVERGPYFSLQWYENGKPRRQRLRKPEQVQQAREETSNCKRIYELAERFAALTRRLGEIERDEKAAVERQKKGL